ncbi:MAG: DUF1161 domain-containing protein [Burkholderiales bacterium]|nr:DUF1161 domain-containing protein [Burkholderiales bacterium]
MRAFIALIAFSLAASPALGRMDCEELKAEIEAKIKANGVQVFTLTIVPNAEASGGEIVGSCDGGTKKIIYKRG